MISEIEQKVLVEVTEARDPQPNCAVLFHFSNLHVHFPTALSLGDLCSVDFATGLECLHKGLIDIYFGSYIVR